MASSLAKHGHVTTTLPKGKALLSYVRKKNVSIGGALKLVRLHKRKGDNAQMVKVYSERYEKKLNPERKTKSDKSSNAEADKVKKTSKTKKENAKTDKK
ncbi:MAG: hypothetical protein ACOCXP_00800 [Candidatus Dojkabacteria bacterium]